MKKSLILTLLCALVSVAIPASTADGGLFDKVKLPKNPFSKDKKKSDPAQADTGALPFTLKGAPSDVVEGWVWYAERIGGMVVNLNDKQMALCAGFEETFNIRVSAEIAEANAKLASDYEAEKISESERDEQLWKLKAQRSSEIADQLKNFDTSTMTKEQKQWAEVNGPAIWGIAGASVETISAGATLVKDGPDVLDKAKDKPIKYASYIPKVPGILDSLGTAIKWAGPAFANYGKCFAEHKRISKAAGIELPSKEEQAEMTAKSRNSAAGIDAEGDF
jgi:hypothetical protein